MVGAAHRHEQPVNTCQLTTMSVLVLLLPEEIGNVTSSTSQLVSLFPVQRQNAILLVLRDEEVN